MAADECVATSTGMWADQLMVSKGVHGGGGGGVWRRETWKVRCLVEFADSLSLVVTNTCFHQGGLEENYI